MSEGEEDEQEGMEEVEMPSENGVDTDSMECSDTGSEMGGMSEGVLASLRSRAMALAEKDKQHMVSEQFYIYKILQWVMVA